MLTPTESQIRDTGTLRAVLVWLSPDPHGERIIRYDYGDPRDRRVSFIRERWTPCECGCGCTHCAESSYWAASASAPTFIAVLPRRPSYPAQRVVDSVARQVEAHERAAGGPLETWRCLGCDVLNTRGELCACGDAETFPIHLARPGWLPVCEQNVTDKALRSGSIADVTCPKCLDIYERDGGQW